MHLFFFISCITQQSSKRILHHLSLHQLVSHPVYFPFFYLTHLSLLSSSNRSICQLHRFTNPSRSIAAHEQITPLLFNMKSLHHAAGLAGILFSLLQATSALPTSDPTTVPSTLLPRALDKYVGCSDDQKNKLGQGFADAATLARWTFDHPISIDHTAYVLPCLLLQSRNKKLIYIANIGLMCRYTHYLRREDEQLAKNVWDLVQQNNDPTNAPYHFTVRCSPGGAECPAGRYVLTSLSLFSHSNRHNTIVHHTSQQFLFSSSTFSALPSIPPLIFFFSY